MKATSAGRNMVDVKKSNRGLILQLIYQYNGLSRKAIAARTGLTPAAITLITNDMLGEGLLWETRTEHSSNTLGRKEVIVDINARHYVALGISLTSSRASVRCCDLLNTVIFEFELSTEGCEDAQALAGMVCPEINLLVEQHQIKKRYLLIGAGIAMEGTGYSPNQFQEDHRYRARKAELETAFSEKLSIPVHAESAVCTMAMAHTYLARGGFQPLKDMLFVEYGPKINTGYLTAGEHGGFRGVPVSLAHAVIDPYGSACDCGCRGCLETLSGLDSLALSLRGLYSKPLTPLLYEMTGGDEQQVTADRMPEFYLGGDPCVKDTIEKGAFYLAMALRNCLAVFHLNSIVVYGELFRLPEYWKMFGGLLDSFHCRDRISLSHCQTGLETIGPAFFMVSKFFEEGGLMAVGTKKPGIRLNTGGKR